MAPANRLISWLIFLSLSLIWGSSFILMKVGLQTLSAYQVAALRILSAGMVLLPVALSQLKKAPRKKFGLILLSGLTGSFIPAFLFCLAETKIGSALTSILNALTPIFTIIMGAVFFSTSIPWSKITGVLISFVGLCILFLSKGNIDLSYLSYASLVLLATICYGLNANIVNRYLRDIGSMNIAAFAFSFLILPSFLILYYTGFFKLPLTDHAYVSSITASIVLGVMGTAVASIIFYMLVKSAGILFTSMVTYVIPFVAIFWGMIYNEGLTLVEVGCLAVILAGIFMTNKQ